MDGDPNFLTTGMLLLNYEGEIAVCTTDTGEPVHQLVHEGGIDAVVVSDNMPDMGPFTLIPWVHSLDRVIPFLLLTDRIDDPGWIRTLESGADCILDRTSDYEHFFREIAIKIKGLIRERSTTIAKASGIGIYDLVFSHIPVACAVLAVVLDCGGMPV
ncbi:MAG: hypothetical protein NT074_03155 [Methanomicrobiales archaeon]|nr:hypothetical protein [Methanomicrobiales archaeon]